MTRAGLAAVLALSGACTVGLAGQAVPPASGQTRIDVSRMGPAVGDRVPDFSLPDQTGRLRTLASIMGRRGAVLVFIRSTDWCPYCRTQMVELQARLPELQAQGLGVAAISYDRQDAHARFAREFGITFPLLADVGSVTIRRFRLLNPVPELSLAGGADSPEMRALVQTYVTGGALGDRHKGVALPGTLVLDRQGRVTSRSFEDAYTERSTLAAVLLRTGAGRAATVPGVQASTAQLEASAYTSDAAVAPGNRFTLVAEVTPKPRMHVYAPGAKTYRVVALTISPQAGLRLSPTRYPPSEVYHFKPLDERVPAYQKPFILTREVVVEASPAAQRAFEGRDRLTILGSLDYQACDDAVCYNPVSLPLSWTVGLKPLLRPAPVKP